MRTILRFAGFMSVFFFGFLAVNYCIFYGIASLFGIQPGLIFYTLFILAAISYPLSAMIERVVSNSFTRVFYTVASAWMGISFYILTFIAIYWLISLFYNIPGEIAGVTIILLTIILSSYSLVNSLFLAVNHIEIPLKHLQSDLKVVQLSDIHIGSIRNSTYMEKIVNKTNEQKPEIVFITGDMVDGSARLHTNTFSAINKIKAPVFFITGNHETYEGLDEVFRVLRNTDMKILRDELVECKGIQIIGVEYSYESDHMENVISKLKIDPKTPSIMLYHLPRELKTVANAGIGLQLSGHTHAGQMFPFNYLVRLMFRYMHGIYTYNETYLYVSPGTGTWGPPMRLGSRCEITVINLKVKNQIYK
jgi:predicted MPP superfamily phosphohydrolase